MELCSRIFVAGHQGLVGSAILRALTRKKYRNLIMRTRAELDLRNTSAVERFFELQQPDYVFLAAATVGGILPNNAKPVDFLKDNLLIQTNVLDAAWRHGAQKLLFLGSSCIYPKFAPQPIKEESLLTGSLEPTNQWYAVAKIAGIKLAQAYRRQYGFNAISLMPTNLYGPNDNFDPETAHVLPALLYKFHEARCKGAGEVTVLGSGTPRREFLYVDDLASAAIHLMHVYDGEDIINVGTGQDISIFHLATLVQEVTGFHGRIVLDPSQPDGTPRKRLDISRVLSLGWSAQTTLSEGIRRTYEWYCQHVSTARFQPAGLHRS